MDYSRVWIEHRAAITNLLSTRLGDQLWAGGRFCCSTDAEDDRMAAFLTAQGFRLRNAGQCEAVAAKAIIVGEAVIRLLIDELRHLSAISGYRLQSVEVGDFEAGEAAVLASEEGYLPWWEVKG